MLASASVIRVLLPSERLVALGLMLVLFLVLQPQAQAQLLAERDAQMHLTALRAAEGIVYVENRGQWLEEVFYQACLGGLDLWVTREGLTLGFYQSERIANESVASVSVRLALEDVTRHPALQKEDVAKRCQGHVVRMSFKGATGRGRSSNSADDVNKPVSLPTNYLPD